MEQSIFSHREQRKAPPSQAFVHPGVGLPACGLSPDLARVVEAYPVAITPAMLELINPDDPQDPIAAQFMPSPDELEVRADENVDPIGDDLHTPVTGIVHRYPDRVLLKLLQACPVYCRFCFRRARVGPEGGVLSSENVEKALAYIAEHSEIWEVILSGGDPLMLSDRRLADVVARLNALPHVKIIRVHTRVPVVDPTRVTPELVDALKGRAPVYVLLHCNHPRELTPAARDACGRLAEAGIPLLSQSVLLRGVNDDPETLASLMRALVEARVKPHYLHHLDRAPGTHRFRVSLQKGQELMHALRGHLSGLCLPTYMLDIPGGAGKVPVGPTYATEKGLVWPIEDPKGRVHAYKN